MSNFRKALFEVLIKRPLMQALDKVYEDDDITRLIEHKAGRATAIGRVKGLVQPEQFVTEADIHAIVNGDRSALPVPSGQYPVIENQAVIESGPQEQAGLPPKAVRRPGRPAKVPPSLNTRAREFAGQTVVTTSSASSASRMPQAIGPKQIKSKQAVQDKQSVNQTSQAAPVKPVETTQTGGTDVKQD